MQRAFAFAAVLVVVGLLTGCGDDKAFRETRARVAQLEKRVAALEGERSRGAATSREHAAAGWEETGDAGATPAIREGVTPGAGRGGATASPDAGAEPPPLIATFYDIRHNSAGTAELSITVKHQGQKPIDAFRFRAFLTDTFNDPVLNRHGFRDPTNVFPGVADDLRGGAIRPGQQRDFGVWPMYGFDNATQATVEITEVHFTDGTTWSGAAREGDLIGPPRATTKGVRSSAGQELSEEWTILESLEPWCERCRAAGQRCRRRSEEGQAVHSCW